MCVLRVSLKAEPCILMICLVLVKLTCIVGHFLEISCGVVLTLGDHTIDVSWTWAVCSYPYIFVLRVAFMV